MKSVIATLALMLTPTAQAQTQQQVDAAAAADDVAARATTHSGASPFNPEQDDAAAVDAALVAARASGKHVMIVFGGSWCHDSDALIAAFARPRAQAMLDARYEMVWVDVPYSQDEREFAVARRFGLGEIEGTPTVLIVRADGTAVNLSDAPRWRNAASRKPAAIVRHFERAVPAATAGR
jgi:Thioredoxin-like